MLQHDRCSKSSSSLLQKKSGFDTTKLLHTTTQVWPFLESKLCNSLLLGKWEKVLFLYNTIGCRPKQRSRLLFSRNRETVRHLVIFLLFFLYNTYCWMQADATFEVLIFKKGAFYVPKIKPMVPSDLGTLPSERYIGCMKVINSLEN
jgi:hypothetical protein